MNRINIMLKGVLTWMCFLLLMISGNAFAQGTVNTIVSPQVNKDRSVTFRLYAPDAEKVELGGTWVWDESWSKQMVKNDSGVFVLKIGPIDVDMYEYYFRIDGVKVLDPSNPVVSRDGPYIENRLTISGGKTDMYDVKDVPHGIVSAVWYPSPTLDMERRLLIYTPPGYDKSEESYPVLYLLHGAGGDEEAWINRGRANYILDNLIASGKANKMIVVVTNGVPSVSAAPSDRPIKLLNINTNGPAAMVSGGFEESLIKDIIPFIESNYRVLNDPEHRAIAGLSMGGYHTQKITNANPGKFDYIGVMSMGLLTSLGTYNKDEHIAQIKTLKESKPKLYYLAIGKDDFLFEGANELRALYDELGFQYKYNESEGGHTWVNWRIYLTELAPMLFK